MLKYKILVKITGSIAAYKAAYLISKLVQNNFEVRIVLTQSALKFIGIATLEGLSGQPVYTDTFKEGQMMGHIELTKWADLTILVPADANTINKYAAGIADNLVTTLFLAHDRTKPYLIAPAMNTKMYEHPATQASLAKLIRWGLKVLATDTGHLACGDEGAGKLLEPDLIFNCIVKNLNTSEKKLNVLITFGGTKENIDDVRFITNLSTGATGKNLSDYFSMRGHNVTALKSYDAAITDSVIKVIEFSDYKSLNDNLKHELGYNSYDVVIHLAAVSDYSPQSMKLGQLEEKLPLKSKLKSNEGNLEIKFVRNPKIINSIKDWSINKNIKLIGFKLLTSSNGKKSKIINRLFSESKADFVVYNSLDSRVENKQYNFEILNCDGKLKEAENASELAEELEKILLEA